MPVWAIVMSHFCQNWGFYTMITMLPTYLAGKSFKHLALNDLNERYYSNELFFRNVEILNQFVRGFVIVAIPRNECWFTHCRHYR